MSRLGTILKIKEREAIIMTEQGDFIKGKRKPGMFVGQQIEIHKTDLGSIMDFFKKRMIYKPAIAGMAVMIALFLIYNQFVLKSRVYAYIDLDINPSLEFVISNESRILQLIPLNEDASKLINGLDLLKKPLETAIFEVIQESEQQGFIRSDKENIIIVSASLGPNVKNERENEEKKLDNVLRSVKTRVESVNDKKIVCEVLKLEPHIKELASENGLSLARQAAYMKAREKGIDLTLEGAKSKPISDILADVPIQELGNVSRQQDGGPESVIEEDGASERQGNDTYGENVAQKAAPDRKEADGVYESEPNNAVNKTEITVEGLESETTITLSDESQAASETEASVKQPDMSSLTNEKEGTSLSTESKEKPNPTNTTGEPAKTPGLTPKPTTESHTTDTPAQALTPTNSSANTGEEATPVSTEPEPVTGPAADSDNATEASEKTAEPSSESSTGSNEAEEVSSSDGSSVDKTTENKQNDTAQKDKQSLQPSSADNAT